jgi:probable selenium-dependent hydroxylase accessory protein YqeC
MQLNSNSPNLTLEQLTTQLPLTESHFRVISLTGGGGKTSLMYRWAACLKDNGLPVVTTTTTKLEASPRNDSRFVEVSTLETAMAVVEKTVSAGAHSSCPTLTLVSDRPTPTGKVSGIEPQWIDLLAERFPAVFFIVEADGSAGKSLKGYQGHEPVVPASTTLLIPVVGLDALGCNADSTHVHRPEIFRRITGLAADELISPETVCNALLHPEGYLRSAPPQATILPLLNKAETPQLQQMGRELAGCILNAKHRQISAVLVGSVKSNHFARVL